MPMRLADYSRRLLALAETLHRWLGALSTLDTEHRVRIARYADEVAGTLARATAAVLALEADPACPRARIAAAREFGRITGYVETMVGVLQHHLDGRKLSGVKRRLEALAPERVAIEAALPGNGRLVGRLAAAEGYFRALADGLRA